jgi:hypothetical protein
MKKLLFFASALFVAVLCGGTANADLVVIDNLDLPTPETAGAQSSYVLQTFTPNVGGIGASDTVADNSPLASSVALLSATFLTAPDGSDGTAGGLFIDVYEGRGTGGTYLGSSTNTNDINSAPALTELTWNFSGLTLDSGSEYTLYFSVNNVAGGVANARLTAANNGGGFVNTYDGGIADDSSNGASPLNFDTRFQVRFNSVPEPTSFALLSISLAGLAARRRRCV